MNDVKIKESPYEIWNKIYWEDVLYGFAIITVDEEGNIDVIPSRDVVLRIGSDGNEENKKYEKERSKE